ncbi:MAG TPA: cytochrome c peroxidase [Chitinivibrionales bacterium]|nr:cytochrome c peroxidase [Chitinivibrionales bacterium]
MSARRLNFYFVFPIFFGGVSLAAPTAAGAGENDSGLMEIALRTFGVLPAVMASPKNDVTPEKTFLGRILFFETRISKDGTASCSRCHLFGLYGTDGLPLAIGNSCKVNPRNAPTVFNAAAQISAHWVGNRTDVEDQAKQALVGPVSLGMPSYDSAMKVLKSIPGYPPLFRAAFPKSADPVTPENFALAIGAFERTLVTPGPLDTFENGDASALSAAQKTGMNVFIVAGCSNCHNGPYLGGQEYKKFGIKEPYWISTKSATKDLGRFIVTGDESDKYVFKVPVLRNIAMTAPYFHDGSVASLDTAVRIMARVQLDKELSEMQVSDVMAFFNALTGTIPDSCLRVPVLPPSQPQVTKRPSK